MRDTIHRSDAEGRILLRGAHCAIGPRCSSHASIQIAGGRITRILSDGVSISPSPFEFTTIDLDGFLLMPGLVNAHDHLQFALYPKLGSSLYRNYIDWGDDIHAKFPEVIARYKSIPRDVRLWWGGIRNLLSGVTTVCHHDTLWPEMQREGFPIKVVQQFGWGHSLALGGDLRVASSATPKGSAFIVHACEGVDDLARNELFELERLGFLDASTVLVHGLAIDAAGASLLGKRGVSLIVCPSSNKFLFGELPDMDVLGSVKNIALGNDSPLTAIGDLLDEIRFTIESCGVAPDLVYQMVTEAPAAVLRLKDSEGTMQLSGPGDLIAVRDTGQHAAERLQMLSMTDIELVMVAGRVQLASEVVWARLPLQARAGLESLCVEGTVRWVRAPVEELLRQTEEVLGSGEVRLGGRKVCSPLSSRPCQREVSREMLIADWK